MFGIFYTDEFSHRYKELPEAIKKKLRKQEKIFRINPHHPSLNTEKLQPKDRELWSFRVDKSYRVIFCFLEGRKVVLLTVGPHNWIYSF